MNQPFENYMLSIGCFKPDGTSTIREVGKFKGIIVVSEFLSEKPLIPLEKPQDYVARVYVWKAEGLQPCDANGKADPYLKVLA